MTTAIKNLVALRNELAKADQVYSDHVLVKNTTRDTILAAIADLEGVAAGKHVIVPVEPTNDMVDAGLEEDTWTPIEIYRAMLAATPAPAANEER